MQTATRPDASVIEKIRKILSKTEEAGCTEAEAATAYAMAARLMAAHNLDMAEIQARDGTAAAEQWAEAPAGESGKFSLEMSLANGIVQEFFCVRGILSVRHIGGKKMQCLRYFGKASNVEVGAWTFRALLSAFDRLFLDYKRRTRCAQTERRLFISGVASGFASKLRDELQALEIERDLTALALRDIAAETNHAMEEKYPKMKTRQSSITPPRGSESTLQAGIRAGRNLNLNRSPDGQTGRRGLPGS